MAIVGIVFQKRAKNVGLRVMIRREEEEEVAMGESQNW
tara:strand:- start:127 stop:240 length:114 start_codon:yes stop_codon:yes gene_type:complete